MKLEKIFLFSILIFMVSCLSSCNYVRKIKLNSDDLNELKVILNKSSEYCAKLNDSSLFFVCREKIEEKKMFLPPRVEENLRSDLWIARTIPPHGRPPKKRKNVYVFDYQLRRKNHNVTERRTLLEQNGQKRHQKDMHLKTKFYAYENVLFGPIGLLSEFQQQYYDYKIIKEEKYKGKDTLVIEAIPLSSQTSEILYGKIWIKKTDFSILKIEWNQKSVKDYEETEIIAAALHATPKLKLTAEFDYEKNGVRFPSEFSFKEVYVFKRMGKGRRYLRTDLSVNYYDYKFFTVDTGIKY